VGNLVGRETARKYVKTGWDYVKHLMALVDCGNRKPDCYEFDMERRTMAVTFMYDNYGFCSTIFVSLNGSPPKAYAVLKTRDGEKFELRRVNGEVKAYYEFDGFKDEIGIGELVVLDTGLSVREPYEIDPETWRPVLKLDLKETFSRDDIIVMNTEVLSTTDPAPQGNGYRRNRLGLVNEKRETEVDGGQRGKGGGRPRYI